MEKGTFDFLDTVWSETQLNITPTRSRLLDEHSTTMYIFTVSTFQFL